MSTNPNSAPGILLSHFQFTLLDVDAVDWTDPPPGEMFHGSGIKFKALSRHPDGWAVVYMVYVPPGLAGLAGGTPERHYHRTVDECGYCLFGELAIIEYDGVEDAVGTPVLFRQGCFYDRKAGSVFGLNPALPSPTGATFLEWRTGPGSSIGEAGADEEVVSIHL